MKDKKIELFKAVEEKNVNAVKNLCQQGVNINSENAEGLSPLSIAVEQCDINMVICLIGYGADINFQNKNNESLLVRALLNKNYQIAELLIKVGANINFGSNEGLKPLNIAVKEANLELVKLLIGRGAYIEDKLCSDDPAISNILKTAKIIDCLDFKLLDDFFDILAARIEYTNNTHHPLIINKEFILPILADLIDKEVIIGDIKDLANVTSI